MSSHRAGRPKLCKNASQRPRAPRGLRGLHMEPGGGKSTPLSPNLQSKQLIVFFLIWAFFTYFKFLPTLPPGGVARVVNPCLGLGKFFVSWPCLGPPPPILGRTLDTAIFGLCGSLWVGWIPSLVTKCVPKLFSTWRLDPEISWKNGGGIWALEPELTHIPDPEGFDNPTLRLQISREEIIPPRMRNIGCDRNCKSNICLVATLNSFADTSTNGVLFSEDAFGSSGNIEIRKHPRGCFDL